MKKKRISTLTMVVTVLFLSIILAAHGVYGQDNEMEKTARKTLEEYKKVFSEDEARKIGFDSKSDFKKSLLGKPFKLYTIAPDAMMNYQEGSEFKKIVTEANYYIYPIISDGVNKALMWMYQKEGQWEVARIGSSKLARALRSTEGTIRQKNEENGIKESGLPVLVRVYQLKLDFFFIKADDKEYIIPIFSLPTLKIEGSKFYTPAQLLPNWKEQLKKIAPQEGEKGIIIKE
jgi:hypothetical protein